MFRAIRRWLGDAEVRTLAQELELLRDRLQDIDHKARGLEGRIERFLNREYMRDARAAGKSGALSADDRALLEDLKRGQFQPPQAYERFADEG